MGDWFTWSEFKGEVLGLLPLDKSRLIQGDDGTYLDRLIKLGVMDLQQHIPAYQKFHEAIYHPTDFTLDGKASLSVLPPNGKVRELWLYKNNSDTRHPVIAFDWEKRFELVSGLAHVLDNQGRVAIREDGYQFYIYPAVTDDWLLSMFWDGFKTDFDDNEQTQFASNDPGPAAAVADYVRGTLAKEIERDLVTYEAYFRMSPGNPGSYIHKRKNLYLNAKERTNV
jgi:hypothetical protein